MLRAWTMAVLAPLITTNISAETAPAPRIGVYYFPGWNGDHDGGWTPIKTFGDREPTQGWYESGSPKVLATQLDQMRRSGLDYVTFDWYWDGASVHADQAVRAYLQVPQRAVKFSIMWANDKPFTDKQWQSIVTFWIKNYFRSPNYLMVDRKPVVTIFTYQGLDQTAKDNKTTASAYLATAQRMARKAGLPGIYFAAGFDDLSTSLITDDAPKAGLSAVTAYNLHRGPWRGERPGWYKLTQGYPALDQAYRQNWAEAFRGPLDVVVPMMSGWDRRPWGGSADPLHDKSISTGPQFKSHLTAARAVMAKQGSRARLGVICCWNEYGEGSYIEPTKGEGQNKLDQIRQVFRK